MAAIVTPNGSAYDAIAPTLRTGKSATVGAKPDNGLALVSASKASKDTVELSDYAKTMLARAKTERAAATKLAALVAEVVLNGNAKASNKTSVKTDADSVTALFKALTGQSVSSQSSSVADSAQPLSDVDPADRVEYLKALAAANRGADEKVKSYRVEVRDVVKVPSAPAEIEQWFNTDGQSYVIGASQVNDPEYNIMAQAIQNRTLKVENALSIPGLNFHNTIVFAGGENGGSVNDTFSYNRDADIFKDPTMNYIVNSNGVVLSWKRDPSA